MLVGPVCCENGYFIKSYEAAAAIVPSVGIIQSVANNLDMFHSKNINTWINSCV